MAAHTPVGCVLPRTYPHAITVRAITLTTPHPDHPMIQWQNYLQFGETLLWEGAPLRGIRNIARLAFLAVFGVPFLLVGIVGTLASLHLIFWKSQIGLGLFTLAIAILLGALGVALVFWQWVDAARAHRTTRYAITNRCAYIVRIGSKQSVDTYPILANAETSLENSNGYDNLWFHLRHERDSEGAPTTTKIGFEGIADGLIPYKLIRSIQAGLT